MTEFLKRFLTSIILSIIVFIIILYFPAWVYTITIGIIASIVVLTEWPTIAKHSKWLYALTPLYPIGPFLVLIMLRQSTSAYYILFLFFTVAAHDIGSYLVGKSLGCHKIVPTISPGKTWEGFFGGYCATCLAIWVFTKHFSLSIILAIIISTVTFLGDIFESYLKRRAHIKDSGKILPGHGGLLDRLDGLLFTALILYILKRPLALFI